MALEWNSSIKLFLAYIKELSLKFIFISFVPNLRQGPGLHAPESETCPAEGQGALPDSGRKQVFTLLE